MATYIGTPMADLRGFLKPNEVKSIIDNANCERDGLLVEVLWMTGARISEVVGLRKCGAIDGEDHRYWGLSPLRMLRDENVLLIKTLKRTRRAGQMREYVDAERRVVVPARLMTRLCAYVDKRDILPRRQIFPISRQYAAKLISEMAERAGVKPPGRAKSVHPHHFRHSHCINFIKHSDGIQGLRKLQKRLNHTNISTTAHYLQFSTKGEQKEIEEMF